MVFALHKFRHYLLGNKFVFYVDHMALVYLVNKPQVSGRIIRWLLLFLKYDFTIMYKAKQNSCSCKYVVKTTRCYITHRCTWLNHKCKFVLHIAKMVEWCQRIFEIMTNSGHIISSVEAEISQESKASYNEEWWIVYNGPIQQIVMMFDNNKSTDGDARITWWTIRRAFCNWNNAEEDIGC
jgi:hypothetical protein